ncbi:MAG: hypothetical protein JO230_09175 [Xanthobacteraceae bacterium]|nr:hypothetical protein [Xanthobacteraceae bacterium]
MKTRIIEHLGQADVLLPSLVAEGLAANDRIKVRMSALQAACEHARDPQRPRTDFAAECRAAGLNAAAMQRLIDGAQFAADGRMTAPDLGELGNAMLADLRAMIAAVQAGAPVQGNAAAERVTSLKLQDRLASLTDILPSEIAQLTGVSQAGADSLHRLVMDLHKALNKLAAGCAEEVVAGAHAYGLLADDHPAIEAFMHGLSATAGLKFNHPGLATTAMRSGARLTIQNDIGATDAHVVVIAIDGNAVTITYTDVHRARSRFFANLLRDTGVTWSGTDRQSADGLGEDGTFYLITGNLAAQTSAERDRFLGTLGSSLVFLIDWNKARKALRTFMPKDQSVRILDWAARNQIGHRAFLELGGVELITTAVHNTAATRIGFGDQLDKVLGRNAAFDFFTNVLRICTDALKQSRSVRLARDRIEADLVRRLKRVDATLMAVVVRQAGLAREIAAAIAAHVANLQGGRPTESAALTQQARRIEEKADRIAIEVRAEISRLDADSTMTQLVDRVEDAVDDLEQAAFIASLIPHDLTQNVLIPLADLGAAAILATEAAASGADAAAEIPEGHRGDAEDALAAVGRLVEIEHKADDCERAVTQLVLRGELDPVRALGVLELARALERATDRLAAYAHVLRTHVLADLTA